MRVHYARFLIEYKLMPANPGGALFESDLSSLPLLLRGKVRDIYDVDDDHLLIVATDRLSAFDVILPDPIPGKGTVLTQISNFWFRRMGDIVPNHLTDIDPQDVVSVGADRDVVADRSVVVKKLQPLPLEAVVRGYLIGSGWRDYCATGEVSGIRLPSDLVMAAPLPQALFTPSSKAVAGEHDENITYRDVKQLVGEDMAQQVEQVSLEIYAAARAYASSRGVIIADTKFEFGTDDQGQLILIDEVLTPDSSRFWPSESYVAGESPASFDKQYVRDYLDSLDWNKQPPAPRLPSLIIQRTAQKYHQAMEKICG
jgi:phosphoribosylaminoimidazole-succinocarboxamide synthase